MADGTKPTTSAMIGNDPLWYKDAVIYQLHVKSFFDSNNDGIGDFAGLIAKLDYIASLGVNTIWILPFYPSPRRDDGYDIAEYKDVSPDYGTMQDARRFIREAHARGMRVITELVINHTSDQHPWFQRARRAKPGSNHRNFYVWSDTDQTYPETRIIFLDTEKSNWTWDPVAGAYFWHRFYSHQPDLNFDNPQVLKAVLNVMHFWLDLGVDGLRLDAIPYLVEREGTNNENLPETHDVLKKIRAELDAHYPDRMLLAEANQWPEDTQEYFGDADECHMAFHFPLMPRMYMAIAKEDRFPITDIMRQTPEIPETCQWAIFLRNHDELTLEMVTDEERDYLWNFYAADRRARINLGIRRRLAPLLERDRRRIELMNALLLSMPGTPVIYYGDEIGMGDNIHLGDRDGVRTPMQWSPDRNGGFSRADPANLVLPAIMDPLYGFEAVNVEAQSRDPHSLLNWMRRMLALRRQRHAFGRGALRFLYPGNRKILAYLREHGHETILCVANMSRTPQAVELDLSAFAGRVPVEMTGGSPFPPIGQLTYLLTLPPYGFYWFDLMTEAAQPAWHVSAPQQLPEFSTLVLRKGIEEIGEARHRQVLEGEVLPAYLPMRRWFGSKDQAIEGVRIAALAPVPGAGVLLADVAAELDGRSEHYLVPLEISWEEPNQPPLPQQLALARVRQGRRVGVLTDAFSGEALARAVIDHLRRQTRVPLEDGEIRFLPTSRLQELDIPADAAIKWLSAEQSNSSLILGDKVVVKVVRHTFGGIHPEVEMTRHLTEAGYANTAPLVGSVAKFGADETCHVLIVVQGFIRNQGDAWTWMLETLKRAMEDALLIGANAGDGGAPPERQDGVFESATSFARLLGRRLGELHAVLSRPSDDDAFAPVVIGDAQIRTLADSARGQLAGAFEVLASHDAGDDAGLAEAIRLVLADRQAIEAAVDRLAEAGRGALVTRIHGDFHLGQILVAQGDAYLIDFEGEPARSLEDRRSKSSPLRDVAGLLRSLDYAAATVPLPDEDGNPTIRDRREGLLDRFRREAEAAVLEGYRAALAEADHKWVEPAAEDPLLDLFRLEKVAYEVRYEAANRPKWLAIPLRGLAAVASRILAGKGTP
ncbi:maltose alpha-D-glucosyltransferase [Chthonobacter rhizosphaerae]|uniref:maltose alpha-D-glucosyltransferase n=1 Tax=Chthonobacter rhizosphaerae TaxID=2735553 RepID=UPI001FEB4CC2|nr:maltose alpha-D-glucosyltransferase [Chthonobacter rhizosphaerae]